MCYGKLLRDFGPIVRPSSTESADNHDLNCYGKLLRDLPRGLFDRDGRYYYRKSVPVIVQRLTGKVELWRSLKTDSLSVALRRLPLVSASIEAEFESSKQKAGLPVDLFNTPVEQASIDFEHVEGETYICGNPPYLGSTWQSKEQKADLEAIFGHRTKSWKSLDYVAGWFMKAADFGTHTTAAGAFVSTNSICQGQQVPILWSTIFDTGHEIAFALTSFKWANLASHNAGVTVVIVGISNHAGTIRSLYSIGEDGETVRKKTGYINAYLVAAENIILRKSSRPLTGVTPMDRGDRAIDGGGLLLDSNDANSFRKESTEGFDNFVRKYLGSDELINGLARYCLWIEDDDLQRACSFDFIKRRLEDVKKMRLASSKVQTKKSAETPHRFGEIRHQNSEYTICGAASKL